MGTGFMASVRHAVAMAVSSVRVCRAETTPRRLDLTVAVSVYLQPPGASRLGPGLA